MASRHSFRIWHRGRRVVPASAALVVGACSGPQSALDPAGTEAALVAELFWVMVVGGGVVWAVVVALALYAGSVRRRQYAPRVGGQLVLWGGAIVPTIVLAGLLAYALWLMPALRPWEPDRPPTRVVVEVVGEQFWWRVAYRRSGTDDVVASANEIRVPAGEPVEFVLTAPDVIHSFWIPALGGKMDMIPGRTNRLILTAERPGRYRGVCAEYCGTSHARMAFDVHAMPADAFDVWLAEQARPSAGAGAPGADLFFDRGCAACHAVRGTAARGIIGPDLSRVGARATIAAGSLPTSPETLAGFIADPGVMKPEAHMPAFAMLPDEELRILSTYLAGLR